MKIINIKYVFFIFNTLCMEHFCVKKFIITICVQNINFPLEFY